MIKRLFITLSIFSILWSWAVFSIASSLGLFQTYLAIFTVIGFAPAIIVAGVIYVVDPFEKDET